MQRVILLPQVRVEHLDGVEVLPLKVVQLEPRVLLGEATERERVLVCGVEDVGADG